MRTAIAAGRPEEAFAFAERARARAFLDLLGNRTTLSKGRTGAMIAEEMRLQSRLQEAVVRPETGAAGTRGIGGSVRDIAATEHRAFVEKVKRESLEQASLMTVEPITVAEVQLLLPPQTTPVAYMVEGPLVIWVIDRDRAHAVEVPVNRARLVSLVQALRDAIAGQATLEAVEAAGRRLDEELIAPMRDFPHPFAWAAFGLTGLPK